MNSAVLPLSNSAAPAATGAAMPADRHAAKSFSFGDFLSIFNPLQHIPVVGSIYRAITGDVIHPLARVLGGALFGGPVGFASAIANSVVESETGKDVGEHALAMLDLEPGKATDPVAPDITNLAAVENATVTIARPVPPAQWTAAGRTPPSPAQLAQAAPEAAAAPQTPPERVTITWATERQIAQADPEPVAPPSPDKIAWATERQVARIDPEFVPPQAPAVLNPIGAETTLAAAGRPMSQPVPIRHGMDPGVAATGAQLHLASLQQQGAPQMAGAGTPTLRGVPLAYQPRSSLQAAARFAPVVPNPPAAEKPVILTPADGPVAVAAPIAPSAPPSGPWFVDAMARGLDRYAEAARQPTGTRLDVSR